MRGNADIVFGHGIGERMLGFSDDTMSVVQPDEIHQKMTEKALLLDRKMTLDRGTVGLWLQTDLFDEGDKLPTENIKECAAFFFG